MFTLHRRAPAAFAMACMAWLGACQGYDSGELGSPGDAVVMAMPMTTASEDARNHFLAGMDAADVSRFLDAREHFLQASSADSTFALAHLQAASFANSLDEFTGHLRAAEATMASASRPEQLMITITRRGFDGDVEGQLEAARELTQVAPDSPRAWLTLGGVLTGMNRHADARASIERAIELAPTMVAAHIQLGNSLLFNDPKDFAAALVHMQRAVELRPDEPNPHDFVGDVLRAQGNLTEARAAYTRAAERAPQDGSPIQQRGHVNSFLGDYDAARADYDSAMKLGKANQAPNYGLYKAFVHVHAGNPGAAIDELTALSASVDGMNIPEPRGVKITLLGNATQIALHNHMADRAAALIAEWTTLMRAQATQVNTDQFTRSQEATIAFVEGLLAAERKNWTQASAKADRYATLVEPDANPRKLEPVHELRGIIAMGQGKAPDAVAHLRQANLNNTYTKWRLALALEAAGQTDEAMTHFREIANNNFNSVGFALVRTAAQQKVGGA